MVPVSLSELPSQCLPPAPTQSYPAPEVGALWHQNVYVCIPPHCLSLDSKYHAFTLAHEELEISVLAWVAIATCL